MKKIYLTTMALIGAFFLSNAQDKKASVTFDGVDDYILIQHDNALNLGTGTFTIEALITIPPTSTASSPMVLSKKGTTGTSQDGFLFGLKSGKIALELEGTLFDPGFGGFGKPGAKPKDLRDGICHHMAWVRDQSGGGDSILGYQDGEYVRNTKRGALNANNQPCDISNLEDVWIGWSEDFNSVDLYQWGGEIKEVRIWNTTRTAAEIMANKDKHLVGNEAGLVAYWRLNENFGQTVYDCSGNGNNGVMKNGATWKNFICDNMTNSIPNNCVNGQPLGVNDIQTDLNISLYPNPVSDELRILSDQDVNMNLVQIFDLKGKKVLQANWTGQDGLNIADLNKGMYLVQISSDNEVIYKSMIQKQ